MTAAGSKRVLLNSIGQEFYTVQIRVELDDDTGNDEGVRVEAVSATYSVRE